MPLPPLAGGLPVLGNSVSLMRDPLGALVDGYRALGPIFRVRAPGRRYTVMAGPAANAFLLHGGERYLDSTRVYRHVARELSTDAYPVATSGDRHRALRRMLAPAFSREAVSHYIPTMVATTTRLLERWAPGDCVRVPPAMRAIVAEQVGAAMANRTLGDRLRDAITFARVSVGAGLGAYPAIARLWPGYRRAKHRMLAFVGDVVAEHVATPAGADRAADLIDVLLAARDPAGNALRHADVVSNAQMVYSNTLLYGAPTASCLLYALLKHPGTLRAVRDEIDAVVGGAPITMAALRRLPTLAAATKESMRLHPVALTIPRVVARSFDFKGCRVERGTVVLVATCVSHFLPELFLNPDAFDVTRYSEPRNEHLRPGAFAPFGLGAHPCPAAGLMETTVMAAVAAILQALDLELDPPDYVLRRVVTPFPEPEDRFAVRVLGRRSPRAGLPRADAVRAQAPPASLLGGPRLAQVAARAETRRYAAGDLIVRQGDPADAFFIVMEGQAEVCHMEAGRAPVVLARRGPGEHFGEVGLLHHVPRTATVRAATPVTVLALDRQSFTDIVAEWDLTSEEIGWIVRERMVSARLATALPALTPELIARVTPRFELFRYPPRATVIRQGDAADRFYIVVDGFAEVVNHHPRGEDILVGRLGPGDYFGEIGLVERRRRTATVRAATALEVMALDREAFQELMDGSTQTSRELADVIADRLIALAQSSGER